MKSKAEKETSRDQPRDHTRVLVILLAALLLIFRSDLFSGADLFFKAFRDINPIMYGYPFLRINLMSWSEGLFPLWNPYNLLGTPLLAGYQSAVFSPLLWPLVFGPMEALAVPYLLARLVLAGWGAYIFCRRVNVTRSAALAGALSFGLTGYLIQYVNDQNIVIDLLIPWLLLAADRMIKERRLLDVIIMALASALVILGGQPGAALFTLALGYGYALSLALTEKRRMGSLLLLAAAAAIAAIISALQLLPFFEFMPRAWTFHQAGFGSEHLPLSGLITLIAPGFYGPLNEAQQVLPLIRIAPYIGAVPAILALAAALRPRHFHDAFFTGALAVSLGVLSGLPLFNLIPRLPGLGFLTFIKYIQPLAAFSAAFLAAAMIDELKRGRGRIRVVASALLISAAAVAASVLIQPGSAETARSMNGAVILCIVLAFATAMIVLALRKIPQAPGKRALSASVITLIFLDLVFASTVNHAFMFRNMAREGFAGVRKIIKDDPYGRFIASDDIMVPNQGLLIPGFEFGLADGLIIKESVDVFSEVSGLSGDTLYHEFTRYHSLRVPLDAPPSPLSRLIGLSCRLSRLPLPANKTIAAVLDRADLIAPSPAHFAKVRMTIADDTREAVFAHPPARLSFTPGQVEAGTELRLPLTLAAGIDPRAAGLSGDGVWFMVMAGGKEPALSWALYQDPRRQPGDRFWKKAGLSLATEEKIELIALPGNSFEHDWAAWGDLRMEDDREIQPDAMADGIRSYEDRDAGPRVFVEAPGRGSCSILSYGLQRVSCRAEMESEGLLVLADAYYPGWRALVNGKEERIIKSDHGLRAVLVPAGKFRVEFVYEPASFRVALWAALSCLLAAVFLGVLRGSSSRSVLS